jgi:nitrogen fixation-related uncharacterized protein
MSVMVLQVFVSLMLVLGSVVLFVFTVKARTFEHADRLSLTPLDEDQISSQPKPQPVKPNQEIV